MIPRPIYTALWQELAAEKAMVFMAGPRQAGKTTLAKAIAGDFANHIYFNWDVLTDRRKMQQDPYFFENAERSDHTTPIVIFDEIHKHKNWKNYLKGAYDKCGDEYRFLVTGSGRLDAYRRSGDSLAGRYVLFHLWPLTLAELVDRRTNLDAFLADPLDVVLDKGGVAENAWQRLAQFSGFPEPYVSARATSYRRWSRDYHAQLIREDIRDMTGIKAVADVEMLFSMLPERVASPLSIPNLAGDLEVSYNTVKNWLTVLERFYLVFSLEPWTRKVARAVRKARKVYLFDYAAIEDPAKRFENMVALELFRAVTSWNDLGYGPFGLHFIRNQKKEEVDFLLTRKRRPLLLIETKSADMQVEAKLTRFQKQLGVPAVHLVDGGKKFIKLTAGEQDVLVAPAHMWLPRLP
jgi:uncharacterized protein